MTATGATDRELLEQAAEVLRRVSLAALTVKPRLDQPYPEAPQWTPWTRWMEADVQRAHGLSVEIRRHLGIPHPFSRKADNALSGEAET